MQLIALTGGIASGKSTIGRRLESLGAVRIDADQLARDAIAPGSPGLERVKERFGDTVFDGDGTLDRAALGQIVFSDSSALADLNAVVHPEVRRLGQEAIEAAAQSNPEAIVVYEIPLFVESGAGKSAYGFNWDWVVVADAPEQVRVDRVVTLRGLPEQEARDRVAHQASDEERRAIADVIIDTSGSEEHTLAQVDELWKRIGTASST